MQGMLAPRLHSARERAHLADVGNTETGLEAAGTYAKHILSRLLIDLSWNSSRLEGNTYSLLDTRRLIEFGEEAEGRNRLEAQVIINHKDAIEFLVGAADEIGFNRYRILTLHAILAQNLKAGRTFQNADEARLTGTILSEDDCHARSKIDLRAWLERIDAVANLE